MHRVLASGFCLLILAFYSSADARTVRTHEWTPIQIGTTTIVEDRHTHSDRYYYDRRTRHWHEQDREHRGEGWRKGGKCPPGHRKKGEC